MCLGSEAQGSVDLSSECRQLLRCVAACGRSGRQLACSVCAGHATQPVQQRHLQRHKAFGCGAKRSLQWWKAFLPYLLSKKLLEETPARLKSGLSYAALTVTKQGEAMQRLRSYVGHNLICL